MQLKEANIINSAFHIVLRPITLTGRHKLFKVKSFGKGMADLEIIKGRFRQCVQTLASF